MVVIKIEFFTVECRPCCSTVGMSLSDPSEANL